MIWIIKGKFFLNLHNILLQFEIFNRSGFELGLISRGNAHIVRII